MTRPSRRQVHRRRAGVVGHPGAVGDLEERAEPVRGGLVGAEDAEVARASVAAASRRAGSSPSTRVASAVDARRAAAPRPRMSRKSGRSQVAQQQAAIGVRVGAHAARARRAPARRGPARARRRRRTAPRAGSSSASLRAAAGAPGCRAMSASGTWCERQKPSTFLPSTSFGPVQPFGRAQHDHRPARAFAVLPRRRARPAGSRGSRSNAASSVAAIAACIASGSSPSTK